jgi:hypothetical protein
VTDDALALAAARHRLGLETADGLRTLGIQLLAAGHDEALPLAIADDASLAELTPIFERLCERRGVPLPAIREARRTVTQRILRDIAEDNAPPEAGLALIVRELEPWQEDEPDASTSTYLGQSWGLHHLVGAYWSYDDLRDGTASIDGTIGMAAIPLLDAEVVRLAHEWLQTHAPT